MNTGQFYKIVGHKGALHINKNYLGISYNVCLGKWENLGCNVESICNGCTSRLCSVYKAKQPMR